MIRSMLYATDLGVYAPYVLQHALALARSFKADLYVIHAVEPMGRFAESVLQSYLDAGSFRALNDGGVTQVMANIEQRVLQSFREDLCDVDQDLALIRAVRVRQGDPAQVILDQVAQLGVDLLVVGSSSGHSGATHSIGRTAHRVLQLSTTPVYLVPEPGTAGEH
ncbi:MULTISPECIES: universal stress protein [unclassified Pseudomonas]|uniref:universal stress protein n=1 Tax=unclassified Pseudomonas TaxID=196821 RepID=UPI000BC819C6|nr:MULTISPECIES: universal stress protein [unclassified Pseudomonas]PVZ13838.1 nucleotide-binding universal stress UspA family protein [Pseudomonas sp. URIL14HWK12:I12]PVZ24144.1 nucleotide-binding universal stress UspA family protein [Pseudomonas sp. URIL14HWK12:I10]PVZ33217.1 nucleotide-binding universal stress UspA family protein [Pseudomonas sp. URIL14HWK12:I11]SNZ10761.1 Nucleotide-binding universal stress protein, UspA family [Pseudomonas sp. URIL14HWK12:I9]